MIRTTFDCLHCDKYFDTYKKLKAHMEYTHGDPNQQTQHQCRFCLAAFATKYNVRRHESTTHNQIKNFTCENCGKEFSFRWSLLQHYSQHHGSGRTFTCEKCQKSFSVKSNLKRHEESCQSTEELRKQCTICWKTFKTTASLYNHEGQVHRRHERPTFICVLCGESFSREYGLRRHVFRKHTEL